MSKPLQDRLMDLKSINWELRTEMYVVEPIRKLLGEPTTAELAAQALDELVDDEKIAKAHAEHVELWEKMKARNIKSNPPGEDGR
jgi:hypothetical protein